MNTYHHLPHNAALLTNHHYYTGSENYHAASRYVFGRLLIWGLRPNMTCLDIGAGSLRTGRWLLTYLEPGNYYAIEPETAILEAGIAYELPAGLLELKRPTFSDSPTFHIAHPPTGKRFAFAFAWNVFIHLGADQLATCLAKIHAEALYLNVQLGPTTATLEKSHTGWSYKHASHAGYRHTESDLHDLAATAGYKARHIEDVPHDPNNPPPWGPSHVYLLTPK